MVRLSNTAFVRCLMIILATLFLTSCASTSSTTREEDGTNTSFSFHGSGAEADIAKARQLRVDGQYNEAATLLLSVYKSPANESQFREEALFEVSQVHSYLLNSAKDYDKALGYLEQLLDEFPETEFRDEAEEQIKHIKALQSR